MRPLIGLLAGKKSGFTFRRVPRAPRSAAVLLDCCETLPENQQTQLWRRIALWTALSALLSVTASVVFLLTVNLGFLKPQVEARVTRALGRTFAIEGERSVATGGVET